MQEIATLSYSKEAMVIIIMVIIIKSLLSANGQKLFVVSVVYTKNGKIVI